MNVTGLHHHAIANIQFASTYLDAFVVSVNLGSTIIRALVSVRICVYVKSVHVHAILAFSILKRLSVLFVTNK